jgi:hypothetical protein
VVYSLGAPNLVFPNAMQLAAMKQLPQGYVVHIKENSFRAKLATIKMRTNYGLAMVWGNQILLFNVSKQDFLADKQWVCHELRHVVQAYNMGKWTFLWRYLVLGLRHGYHHHPMEIDARMHEQDLDMLQRVEFC